MSFACHRILCRLTLTTIAAVLTACATPNTTTQVHLVALNDFHGNLEASTYRYTGADHVQHTVKAGGVETLAAALHAWRKEDGQLLLVGAGDLVGASPPLSSMWADEPSIEALNGLGLRVSSVGNHEFDPGRVELLRQQNGGCASPRPDKACQFEKTFTGAHFSYLAANVIDKASGKPILPAYDIEQAHGVKIAFIGAVLKDTASIVTPGGVEGLEFIDEADAINGALPALRAQGIHAFVVLIHQGGHTDETPEQPDCRHLQGPLVDVIKRLDPEIKLVVSGHSHTGYTCRVDGRLVTQGDMGGHLLTRIQLDVDTQSGSVREVSAKNVVMLPDTYPPDEAMQVYLQRVRARSAVQLARPVAHLGSAAVTRLPSRTGESAFGDLVADSMLAATRAQGAQIAFVNSGGLRQDLEPGPDRVISEGQVRAALPFANTLVVMNLSGAQLRQLLEEQGQGAAHGGPLQVSQGLSYRWNQQAPSGSRASDIRLDGAALEDGKVYRITVNNFMAQGGDHFSIFTQGSEQIDTGIVDVDALKRYLADCDAKGQPAGAAEPAARIMHRD
ncbi:MAG: bifunctional metallophosphatase/5'-nucleotidase [Burkholderiaceae bacterium]|nr:bifunctional metallophosphatase/5'-nucleotidase [Burkholderiaceae bacterium]